MNAADNKAVFLSYASQDAEAVARIAEALRASGVEVWFDRDELVGGDAWDAKIRGQIASCALFVPVISAATQARREGYFRIEWKLAAQRTHAMADGTPFLLPVVIDDTRDAEALVPAEFKAVQWTRLPGGSPNVAFVQRIPRLLVSATEAVAPTMFPRVVGASIPPTRSKKPGWWLGIAALGVVALGLIAFGIRSVSRQASPVIVSPASGAGASARAPSSPAQVLVERAARVLETSDQLNRENVYLAEDMVKRALALEPDNADAWLVSSQLSYLMVWLLTDISAQRRELLLQQSKRAFALAPASTAARLATINAQALVFSTRGPTIMADLERDARALVAAEPQNWRAHRVLGLILRNLLRGDESIAVTRRAYELSRQDPGMAADLINVLVRRNLFAEAETVRSEAMTTSSSGRLLCWDAMLKLRWWGDTAAAREALKSWPGWLSQEDRGLFQAWQTWMWSRQPEQALGLTRVAARDMVRDFAFYGPVAALRAQANELAGRSEAAEADWQVTLERAERELATDSDNEAGLYWKAWALARLGRTAEAKSIVAVLTQRYQREPTSFFKGTYLEPLQLLVGERQAALTGLRARLGTINDSVGLTRAMLKLDPAYDAVRADPEFQELLRDAPAPAGMNATPTDKSVAVLPFTNLSQDKENEYFADGIHVEVIDRLQALRDLRVVSLQSVLSYRGTTKRSPEIARELGVAYLLSGSVRRAGNDVRVSVQLVDARSDTQLWALPPETRGVANVFAVQTAIAQATANALKAVLTPSERAQLAEKSTENMAAYELFLRSRELMVRDPFSPASLRQNAEWLRQAAKLDPKFARAWTALSRTLIQTHFLGIDRRPEVLAEAKAALDKAVLLAPDNLDTQLALAGYYYQGLGDYERALAQCAALAVLHPNNPLVTRMPGLIFRRQGNWPAALQNLRKAVELDRGDASLLRSLTQTLRAARRWDEALIEQRRLVELVKGGANDAYTLGEIPFLANGSTKEMAECIQGLEKELGPSAAVVIDLKKRWAVQRGDLAEAIRLDELQPYFEDDANRRAGEAARAAITLMVAGKTDAARLRLGSYPEELRKQVREKPDDIVLLLNLARMEIVRGNGNEGVRHAEKAMALAAKSDQWNAASIRAQLVGMLAWTGQIPRALEELRLSLREPGGARVHEVRCGAWYVPLRGDPRFETMLEDPKNNAPLF